MIKKYILKPIGTALVLASLATFIGWASFIPIDYICTRSRISTMETQVGIEETKTYCQREIDKIDTLEKIILPGSTKALESYAISGKIPL